MALLRIGIAGWAVPKEHRDDAPSADRPVAGSHLERYARRFNAVEINSSFYRSHRRSTYERWAAAVPANFQFAAKLPKTITHVLRLRECGVELDRFLAEVSGLGTKLAVLLVQLPPSLEFEARTACDFFKRIRAEADAHVVCEPRHVSWFEPAVNREMARLKIGRVAADPSLVPGAADPAGDESLVYFRLHGAPKMYYSSYDSECLSQLDRRIRVHAAIGHSVWCVFDNTAESAAWRNALELQEIDRTSVRFQDQ
jgi:uncharacterized protein YecE (DUF72 family)